MKALICGNKGLALILAAFLLLGGLYSVTTPLFEASDEIFHYPFVQFVASGQGLPVQDPARRQAWEQEGGQPPLYYLVTALATAWIDTRDLPDRLWHNPHAQIGIPLAFGNKNMVIHTGAEDFPWRGATLAVHLIRFLSLIFSAGTVALTYRLAKTLPGPVAGEQEEIALAAAVLVAFNPMFLFISASVNNDTLATLLATASLLLLARLMTQGMTARRLLLLGLVLGLAALTKVSTLGLLPLTALVITLIAWRGRDLRAFLRGGVLTAAPVLLLAGWWYARNWLLYQDVLGWNVWLQIAGPRRTPIGLWELLAEMQGFRISFWGNFGGVNIIAPEFVYVLLDGLTLLAGLGLLLGLLRRTLPALLLLPAAWLGVVFVALIRWTLLTYASQGRLVFPAIAAVALLLAWGLSRLPGRRATLALAVAFLVAFAVAAPFLLIAPAYAPPPLVANEELVANRVHIVYDEAAELVGYVQPQRSVPPGDALPLTLYWRARSPMKEDFSVYIHLYDGQGNRLGQWDAYPGNGLLPTSLWPVGQIFADEYRVPVSGAFSEPKVARVEVGLYRARTLQNLTARDPAGQSITPTIARFKVAGVAPGVQMKNPTQFNFANQIELAGYEVSSESLPRGGRLSVRLLWRSLAAPPEDYTVFVHLLDAAGQLAAQGDAPPQSGAYPTSFWDVGETVLDVHELTIPLQVPPGDYRIAVGLYRPGDGARLSVPGVGDRVVLPTSLRVSGGIRSRSVHIEGSQRRAKLGLIIIMSYATAPEMKQKWTNAGVLAQILTDPIATNPLRCLPLTVHRL